MLPKKQRKRRAVLEVADIVAARKAATELGLHERALFEWLYTHGARASEPGMARLDDVDLRSGRVQLVHLKGGLEPDWVPLAPTCRTALEAWFKIRPERVVDPKQRDYVFPSTHPGPCYPCLGSGKLTWRPKKDKATAQDKRCHHCGGTGKRWGLSRHEVRHLIEAIFARAKIPKDYWFPHVLRHTAVTHMLNTGASPPAIQERVGHKALATTFGYMKATKAAREMVSRAFDEEPE
jgi:site-specific recombinase XerD